MMCAMTRSTGSLALWLVELWFRSCVGRFRTDTQRSEDKSTQRSRAQRNFPKREFPNDNKCLKTHEKSQNVKTGN
eukprot:3102600-Amphidinium_carterae.1